MTLSEHEQRTLAEIETCCFADDPGFAGRLDLAAAHARRSRIRLIAQCAIWLGSMMLVTGAGLARGVVSFGVVIACYGLALIVAGAVAWIRNRAHDIGSRRR